jgi:hypothetical protein
MDHQRVEKIDLFQNKFIIIMQWPTHGSIHAKGQDVVDSKATS